MVTTNIKRKILVYKMYIGDGVMLKVVELKQTTNKSNLICNMYSIRVLIQDIIKVIEKENELNYDDYIFTDMVLDRVETALQKVDNILHI